MSDLNGRLNKNLNKYLNINFVNNRFNKTFLSNKYDDTQLIDVDEVEYTKYLSRYERIRNVSIIRNDRYRVKKQNLPSTWTQDQHQFCIDFWDSKCCYCGSNKNIQIEHYIPISDPNCPGTVADNMLIACQFCNGTKKDKDPESWIESDNTKMAIRSYFKAVKEAF